MLYTKNDNYTIYRASCLDVMDSMEENSIDCIVTDPPYEIGFMNKSWDNTGIAFNIETWQKALRVLKPGGYLLAFNHSRTFHRMMVAIEDAGFELRDTIMWLYGSGFPKSHNISKAIDKSLGVESEVVGKKKITTTDASPTRKTPKKINIDITKPTSPQAKQWEGYGTALKPAFEPIVVARKPFNTSVAENVLRYGVGGINIDDCRIGEGREKQQQGVSNNNTQVAGRDENNINTYPIDLGRFPANIIHDGSEEATRNMWDWETDNDASRYFYTAKASVKDRDEGLSEFELKRAGSMQGNIDDGTFLTGSGNLRTPFKKNIHPTVKPTDLMQYLVRLVAPKGATVMDIFMGSGSTGKATMIENVERNANYHFIGIDLDEDENGNPLGYCEIAQARIEWGLHFKEIAEAEAEQSILYDDDGTIKVVKQEKLF